MSREISVAVITIILTSAVMSQGKISGYMFGDYYIVVAHHDSMLKGQNGF